MIDTQTPSVWKIIRNDTLASTFAWVPIYAWLLWGVVYPLPAWLSGLHLDINQIILILLIGTTLFCGVALAWRIFLIRSIFANGMQVDGEITKIWFVRSRGQVELRYSYQGARYDTRNPIVKNDRTRALTNGERVALVVDPNNPRRVLMRDLFLLK